MAKKESKFSIIPKIMTGLTAGLTAFPALAEYSNAEELMKAVEGPGHLFDFDFTLLILTAEFLLLMVFLDKTWFGPVGKVLDDRDKLIRDKLSSVKGGGTDLEDI